LQVKVLLNYDKLDPLKRGDWWVRWLAQLVVEHQLCALYSYSVVRAPPPATCCCCANRG